MINFALLWFFSTEFLNLMKKVSKSPMVMDVLNIQGVQRSLERLADLLGKIQKALGEYLERERSSFPRWGINISLICADAWYMKTWLIIIVIFITRNISLWFYDTIWEYPKGVLLCRHHYDSAHTLVHVFAVERYFSVLDWIVCLIQNSVLDISHLQCNPALASAPMENWLHQTDVPPF